jgi:hypothetical protein
LGGGALELAEEVGGVEEVEVSETEGFSPATEGAGTAVSAEAEAGAVVEAEGVVVVPVGETTEGSAAEGWIVD